MLSSHTSVRSIIIQIAIFPWLALPALTEGPSWPQFHGPNQDNKSPDMGLLDEWPEGGPELVWTAEGLGYGYSSVSIADGRIFTSGKWICLDWETGERQYAEKGVGKGTLTYADGMLYTLGERLGVGLVKPTPTGHEVVSRFKLTPQDKAPSWAHPVVCGGRLYSRHAEILYVYDVAK